MIFKPKFWLLSTVNSTSRKKVSVEKKLASVNIFIFCSLHLRMINRKIFKLHIPTYVQGQIQTGIKCMGICASLVSAYFIKNWELTKRLFFFYLYFLFIWIRNSVFLIWTCLSRKFVGNCNPMHWYGVKSQYDSKLLASLNKWYICFFPWWSAAEIKCTVHVSLPKKPIN